MAVLQHQRRASLEPLLDRLEKRAEEIAERMLDAIVREIAVYRSAPKPLLDDALIMVRGNVDQWFRVARDQHIPDSAEIDLFVTSAQERARAGIPLDALLHAYRLGARVGWEMLREGADPSDPQDQHDALEISGALMRYLDHVSTAVAQSYLEEREHLVTDEDRQHRELLDILLEENGPTEAVRIRAARAAIPLAEEYEVVLVGAECPDREMRALTLTLRRWRLDPPPIVSARRHEAIMLVPLESADAELCAFIESLQASEPSVLAARAKPEHHDLQGALNEAETVLQVARAAKMTGCVRLEDVIPHAIVHQAGGRTTKVLRDLLSPVQEGASAADLIETLRCYFETSESLTRTAEMLHVHKNTVTYRLRRVAALTGQDPMQFEGALVLYAALQVSGH